MDADTETAGTGPLDGLRVLEIAEGVAGPACAMQLAGLGAEVWKVEPPGGDRTREWGPPLSDGSAAIFHALNRAKRSVVLDLCLAPDRDRLMTALPAFDAAVIQMDPPERADCGIDWAALAAAHPRLVLVDLDDHGREGPLAGAPGSELTAQALSGFTRFVGDPGAAPCRVGFEVAGMGSAMHGVQAVLAGLIARDRTGAGQRVGIAALGQLLSLITIMFAARTNPDRWLGFHLNGPQWRSDIGWETADGQVTFDFRHGMREGWAGFCRDIGLERLLDDPDYADWRSTIYNGDRKDEFGGVYRPAFRAMTCEEASARINGHGGISVKFHDHAEFLAHPQMRHLDPLEAVPDAPEGARTQVGTPFRLTGTPLSRRHAPAPALDADGAAFRAMAGVAA